MTLIENAVVEELRRSDAVKAIVGGRIHEDDLPENIAVPAILVTAETTEINSLSGGSGVATSVVFVDCLGLTVQAARRVRKEVVTVLGDKFDATWEGLHVQSSVVTGYGTGAPPDWMQAKCFNKRLRIEIFHAT